MYQIFVYFRIAFWQQGFAQQSFKMSRGRLELFLLIVDDALIIPDDCDLIREMLFDDIQMLLCKFMTPITGLIAIIAVNIMRSPPFLLARVPWSYLTITFANSA